MSEIKWEFAEPLHNTSAIDDFEIDFAYKIPAEIKVLLQENNCAYPDKDVFDKPRDGMVIAHLLSFNEDSPESVFLFLDEFKDGERIKALPFATDGFGNLICEQSGKIYFWSHETEQMDFIADSIGDFLSMLHD